MYNQIKSKLKPFAKAVPVLALGIPLLALSAFGSNAQWLKSTANAGYGGVPGTSYKHTFSTQLIGPEEVPPVTTNTTGSAYFNVRDTEREIDYAVNVFDGSNITASHLHCAPRGANGPVVVSLFSGGPSNVNGELVSGTLTEADILPAAQQCNPNIQTMPHLVQAMREGQIYVNVHSTDQPAGLVRGQLGSAQFTPSPTPPGNTGGNGGGSNTGSQFITLSDYYRLPNQTFSVSGSQFTPNEQVEIKFDTQTIVATADGGGNFNQGTFNVTFAQMGSTVPVTAKGLTSNIQVNTDMTVGTYDPYARASSYFVPKDSGVTILGYQFAPGEQVKIFHDGNLIATSTADGGGNFGSGITTPSNSGNATYTLTGQSTNLSTSVVITIAE